MNVSFRKLLSGFVQQPIQRILVFVLVAVAAVPISILAVAVYHEAWDNARREIHEKHRLLALNLVSPLYLFIDDNRKALSLVTDQLQQSLRKAEYDQHEVQRLFLPVLKNIGEINQLALLDAQGGVSLLLQKHGVIQQFDTKLFQADTAVQRTLEQERAALSDIHLSPVSHKPVFSITQPVFGADGELSHIVMAELGIDLIEKVRRNIHFGVKGHSTIVDARGHVIAHPNPVWMEQVKDLSHLSVVRKMMAGETGVTEFFSPFVKQQMVAGYTSVPELGWGVMVPQPKSEVQAQVGALLYTQFKWGALGLGVAIVLSVLLARLITRPINGLADAARQMDKDNYGGQIPGPKGAVPSEIQHLYSAMQSLVGGLQQSQLEVQQLNDTLQQKVDQATGQLRRANIKLKKLASRDYLTELANRRHFEQVLREKLMQNTSAQTALCVMLIDVDNFKEINDCHGHAAGDAVLIQMAPLLGAAAADGDIVARYGGDEFVLQIDSPPDIAIDRARCLRGQLESQEFRWQDTIIKITVSIGLVYHAIGSQNAADVQSIHSLLQRADKAMYEAKKQGKNAVVEVEF